MKAGLLYSLLLHIGIVLLLVVTPKKKLHDLSDAFAPISVEIMPIEEETRVLKNKTAPEPEKLPEQEQNNTIKEERVPAPLPIPEPEPEPILEPEPAPEKIPDLPLPPKPEAKPELKVEDVVKPTQVIAPKLQTKPLDIAQKIDSSKESSKARTFAAVLRDLKEKQNKTALKEIQLDSQHDEQSVVGRIGDHMSMSELDAVRRQIQQCWNIPAGLREAYDMIVDVEVNVAPDGTVQSARVVNGQSNDPQFRAAAESARRATLNPKCNPLQLPREKYAQWKNFTFRFNPRDLL